jgi:hypothetical protein
LVLALGWSWSREVAPRPARRDLGPGWPAPVERWTSGLAGGYAGTNIRPLGQRLADEGARPGRAVAHLLEARDSEAFWLQDLARAWQVPRFLAAWGSTFAWLFSPTHGNQHRRYLAFMDEVAKELETMERRA